MSLAAGCEDNHMLGAYRDVRAARGARLGSVAMLVSVIALRVQ